VWPHDIRCSSDSRMQNMVVQPVLSPLTVVSPPLPFPPSPPPAQPVCTAPFVSVSVPKPMDPELGPGHWSGTATKVWVYTKLPSPMSYVVTVGIWDGAVTGAPTPPPIPPCCRGSRSLGSSGSEVALGRNRGRGSGRWKEAMNRWRAWGMPLATRPGEGASGPPARGLWSAEARVREAAAATATSRA
jgi:hypothetical protein